MKAFIGRQPIFKKDYSVYGYELLYRDNGESKAVPQFLDGNKATSQLLSDAVSVFGLKNLTDQKFAFINFTDTLLMGNLITMMNKQDLMIEILESVHVTQLLVDRIKELKEMGYRFALDDYDGSDQFDELLSLVDIIKVDFMLSNSEKQKEFGKLKVKYPKVELLAEKVETEEEFQRACDNGYTLFQGFYFEKPSTLQKKVPQIPIVTYNQLLMQLNSEDGIDLARCASIIKKDALLTYRLLRKVKTLQYYRGNQIQDVNLAVSTLGQVELRRWLYFMLIRDNNVTNSTELVQKSLIRALFSESIIKKCRLMLDPEKAFLIGIFSLLDCIMDRDMKDLLEEIEVNEDVREVLLNEKQTYYSILLQCVCSYENANNMHSFEDYGIKLSSEDAWRLYMKCFVQTDQTFRELF